MSIDSKKILGDTAEEWHDRTDTNASDFIGEGVHSYACNIASVLDGFKKLVPKNAEVVVNYKVSAGEYYYASGTALIPKGTKKAD